MFCAALLSFSLVVVAQDSLGRWRIRKMAGNGTDINYASGSDDQTNPDVDPYQAVFQAEAVVNDPLTGGFYVYTVSKDKEYQMYGVGRIQLVSNATEKTRSISTLYGRIDVNYTRNYFNEREGNNIVNLFEHHVNNEHAEMAINSNGSTMYFLDYDASGYTCIRKINITLVEAAAKVKGTVSDYVGIHASGTGLWGGTVIPTQAPTLAPSTVGVVCNDFIFIFSAMCYIIFALSSVNTVSST